MWTCAKSSILNSPAAPTDSAVSAPAYKPISAQLGPSVPVSGVLTSSSPQSCPALSWPMSWYGFISFIIMNLPDNLVWIQLLSLPKPTLLTPPRDNGTSSWLATPVSFQTLKNLLWLLPGRCYAMLALLWELCFFSPLERSSLPAFNLDLGDWNNLSALRCSF